MSGLVLRRSLFGDHRCVETRRWSYGERGAVGKILTAVRIGIRIVLVRADRNVDTRVYRQALGNGKVIFGLGRNGFGSMMIIGGRRRSTRF